MDPLVSSLRIAGAGIAAQSARLRTVSENVANADATSQTPGGDPYRRKVVSFESNVDDATASVRLGEITQDQRPFRLEFEPGHPAANAAGYVKHSNVDVNVELADMREANRSYLANLQMVKQAREAISATLELLRNT